MSARTNRICLAAAALLLSQSALAQEPARGSLLISTAALAGTMFEETVLLVVHHDDDGSIGIMINRPTNLNPAQIFPDIEGAASYTGVVYFGGPLSPGRPFLIARRSDALEGLSIRIADDVYLSGDVSVLSRLDADQRSQSFSRIYAGNAQWGPGQLASEIDSGAWEVALANASDVFTTSPEELWSELLNAPHGTDIAGAPNVAESNEARLAAR